VTLIKSISGIRGTIGGKSGDGLTPQDIVKFTSSFCTFVKRKVGKDRITVVIGRDARTSGEMVRNICVGTLQALGAEVIDLGLSTTPTVEMAVTAENADAGIILTASHNPKEWNALKLLNHKGEFISAAEGAEVLMISENVEINYSGVQNIGGYSQNDEYGAYHIQKILDLKWVDVDAIKKANFKIAIDCVNSSGGLYIPRLLEALGVDQVVELYTEPTGEFPHNPEPLAENLENLSRTVTDEKCDLGLAVDPDVDRLAFVSEDGSMFGEEYTLVAVADYILGEAGGGNTVSNLSSSRALRDVTQKHGGKYSASAVGEVNVVELMKETDATIGGEGNGGIIFPELHYGRDALVGIALFLTHLAKSGKSCKELRETYPHYEMLKQKVQLTPETDVDKILNQVEEKFVNEELNTTDGVKIDFEDGWVHLRKSNTEPIIRVYSEANTTERASELAEMLMKEIRQIAG